MEEVLDKHEDGEGEQGSYRRGEVTRWISSSSFILTLSGEHWTDIPRFTREIKPPSTSLPSEMSCSGPRGVKAKTGIHLAERVITGVSEDTSR